ncbi:hypothetical protein AB0M19_17805 [Streptomyces sp. NPDC051920]|uniref:hypothetical protein n=1 Tax=Streptomyces sp. NPDC051920 TaxID=3155523 RepID=UPI0034348416
MRAPATRPQRLALTCALISAATLGTVSASAASASDGTTVTATTAGTAGSPRLTRHAATGTPPEGALPAIAYRPTSHAPGDVNTADDAFAACMRDHGQKHFPVFHASKDARGRIRFDVRMRADAGFDPASKSYRSAQKACAPILRKAGVTFSAGSGLPPTTVPGRPGRPGTGSGGSSAGGSGGLPGFHTEQEGPGAADGPTLSGVTERA